jgi:endonuclease V-like protein UPF0215 family
MNVIGFDDGPFARDHRGKVLLVGVVCSGTRMDNVVSSRITRDGSDATRVMIDLVRTAPHVQAVMLQGIAVGGFNVVDVHGLAEALSLPVLVIARRPPDMDAVRRALFSDSPASRPRVIGAARKWKLIERAGALEPIGPSRRALKRGASAGARLWVQRAGLTTEEALRLVTDTTLHGNLPEPLRLAHLIAGGVVTGKSRGGA